MFFMTCPTMKPKASFHISDKKVFIFICMFLTLNTHSSVCMFSHVPGSVASAWSASLYSSVPSVYTHTVHTHDTVVCPHLISAQHSCCILQYCSIRLCRLAEMMFAFFIIPLLVIVHLYNRSWNPVNLDPLLNDSELCLRETSLFILNHVVRLVTTWPFYLKVGESNFQHILASNFDSKLVCSKS